MEGLLLCNFTYKPQSRSNVFYGQIVFAFDFIECHAACQATYHDGNRHTSTSDYGLSVTGGGVENNAILGVHGSSNSNVLARVVEYFPNFCAEKGHFPPKRYHAA